MKTILLLIAFLPLFICAQKSASNYVRVKYIEELTPSKYSYMTEKYASEELRIELGIKQVIVENSYAKKSKKKTTTVDFNQAGKKTSEDWGKTWSQFIYEQDTILTKIERKEKRKITSIYYEYENGKLSKRSIDKNGKRKEELTISYTQGDRVAMSEMKKGRNLQRSYKILNEYTSEAKLSRSIYLVNNKIDKTWNYDCKPEGEIMASKSDDYSSICKYASENNDGSYIDYFRIIEGGKPYLRANYFTVDSVFYLSKKYEKDTVLISEWSKQNNVEQWTNYSSKGKFRSQTTHKFNEAGYYLGSEYLGKNRKPHFRTTYTLNDNNTLSTMTHYSKGKLYNTAVYTYNFY